MKTNETQNSRADRALAKFWTACSVLLCGLATIELIAQILMCDGDIIPLLPLTFLWYLTTVLLRITLAERRERRKNTKHNYEPIKSQHYEPAEID